MAITETPETPTFASYFTAIVDNIERVVQGKRDVIELAVVCMVAEGHLLVEDVPGVGKTSLAKAMALSIEGSWGRVQFTPDLLPTDVVGVTVWNRGTNAFEFKRGPIFTNLVLADEINRASPKTQSALLEAMEERQVTVDGTTHPLTRPFMVIATQNPLDHEGTYPLPESQLDRFLLRMSMGYPTKQFELQILETHGGAGTLSSVSPVVTVTDVQRMIVAARGVHVAPPLRSYLVDLATASRAHRSIHLGMSPRATLALQKAARALAAARGRSYVTPDDVKAIAVPVLAHRLVLSPEAQLQGLDGAAVVQELLASVPVPVAAADQRG
ncbi:MAG: AAA family ATPase [Acidimicrobiia bacterium]